jgi:hypothetical protein
MRESWHARAAGDRDPVIQVARQLAIVVLVIGAILLPMYAPVRIAIIGMALFAALIAVLLKLRLKGDE